MIKIVSIYPYIEKRVRGKINSDADFFGETFTYKLNSEAIKIGDYLSKLNVDNKVYGIVDADAIQFNDNYVLIQSNHQTKYQVIMIEDKNYYIKEEEENVSDNELYSLMGIIDNQQDDILVYSQLIENLTIEQFNKFYNELSSKSKIKILTLNHQYLECLKNNKCSVLLLNKVEYTDIDNLIDIIQNNYLELSNIIVYPIHSNKILVFKGTDVYQCEYLVADENNQIYYEAIMAGISDCAQKNGDIKYLLKSIISYSVGASLSNGLKTIEKDVIKQIWEKVIIYKIR